VLLLTVPECAVKSPGLDAKRAELNALIMGDKREGIEVFDLHAVMPYHSLSEEEREKIWDDGLHFTPKGYERMGELIAGRMGELLEKDGATGTAC
jgi:lysophospholipase L1-like esterase